MRAADISNDAWEEIMYGITRCSVTVVASLCVAALAGERAFGQMPKGEAPYRTWHDGNSRVIREAPNGDLFVADTTFDAVRALRVSAGSETPVRNEVFAGGLKRPFGIAFYPIGSNPRWVYIANSDGVVRFRYRNGDLKATGKPEQIIVGTPTIHRYARGVAISADGHRLYFSVGSASNVAQDIVQEPRQMAATGLHNCDDMTIQPATGELWCDVDERGEPRDSALRSALPLMAFHQSVQAGYDAAKSRALYIANCSACHQSNGEGLPGVFPPLKGSGVVNKDDAVKHIQVVLNGMQGARAGGVVYAAAMPPFAGALSDAEIAGIIDYERSSWGNHGAPVAAAQVAAERARPK
jgi:mono/diheme cytochrome c family protein